MSVFVVFLDEVAVDDTRGTFLVAGYVAQEVEWRDVAAAWQERVLDGPPKLPYLRMNDIRNRMWQARFGITPAKSERRVDEAVRVVGSAGGLLGLISEIKRSDVEDAVHAVFGSNIPDEFKNPDYTCYVAYFTLVVRHIRARFPEAEKINFVVSEKEKITHWVGRFHEAVKCIVDTEMVDMVGEFIPASMKGERPLQWAALLCWHLERHHSYRLDVADHNRLSVLLDRCDHKHEWSRPDLERLAEKIKARSEER